MRSGVYKEIFFYFLVVWVLFFNFNFLESVVLKVMWIWWFCYEFKVIGNES